MEERKIRVYVLDHSKADPAERAGAAVIPATLEGYYKTIGCDLIDIAHRTVGGVEYDIILDDEGLLKETVVPSAISADGGEVRLVGPLIICRSETDENGEIRETDINQFDVWNLEDHIKAAYIDGEKNNPIPVLVLDGEGWA